MNKRERRAFWRAALVTATLGAGLLWWVAQTEGAVQAGGIKVVASQPYLDSPTTVRAIAVVYRTRNTGDDAYVTLRLFRNRVLRGTNSGVLGRRAAIKDVAVVARCRPSAPKSWWLVVDGLSRGRPSQAVSFRINIGCS